jgi:Virulence factor BrkB
VATLSSLAFVAAGTVAVASSLQQIYEKVFRQPRRGMRDLPRLLIWVAVVCGVVAFQSMVGRPVRNAWGGHGMIDLVTFAIYTPFFWWSMHFLLAGRVGWRRLLPSAVATGSLLTVLGVVSEFYFSSMIITDSRTFGDIGAVFALLTWLIAMGVAIILGALAGAVWHNRRHQQATPSQRQPSHDDAPAAFIDDSDQPNLPAGVGGIEVPRHLPHRPIPTLTQLDNLSLELRRERTARAPLLALHILHDEHPLQGQVPDLGCPSKRVSPSSGLCQGSWTVPRVVDQAAVAA